MRDGGGRSEEHTSELQSYSEISYAVFCLKKKNNNDTTASRRGCCRDDRVRAHASLSSCRLFAIWARPLLLFFFFLTIRPPPRSTLILTLFPYTTLFRSRWSHSFPTRCSSDLSSHIQKSRMPSSACDWRDRKSTRLNSSHIQKSRMPSSA